MPLPNAPTTYTPQFITRIDIAENLAGQSILKAFEFRPYFKANYLRVIEIFGHELSFLETKPDKVQAEAKTIFFIHGNSMSVRAFDMQFSELADRYRLIGINLPGHQDSECLNAGDYTLPHLAQILARFIEKLNLEKVILVGWSLGASVIHQMIALTESSKINEKILGIVNIDQPPLARPMDMTAVKPNENLPLFFSGKLDSEQVKKLVQLCFSPETCPPSSAEQIVNDCDQEFRSAIFNSIVNADYKDETIILQNLDMPYLLVSGTDSQITNVDYLKSHAPKNLWGNNVHQLLGGHSVHYENSTTFNELLVSFVDGL